MDAREFSFRSLCPCTKWKDARASQEPTSWGSQASDCVICMSQFLSELQTPSVCLNFSRRCLGATKFLNPFDNRRDRRLPLSVFVRFLLGISYVFETVSREWSKSTKIAKNGACSSLAERRSVYGVGDGSRGPGRRLSPSPHH